MTGPAAEPASDLTSNFTQSSTEDHGLEQRASPPPSQIRTRAHPVERPACGTFGRFDADLAFLWGQLWVCPRRAWKRGQWGRIGLGRILKRALLVVGVQNVYVDGVLAVGYPSHHVSLPNVAMAMDNAADSGIPVVIVQIVSDDSASPLLRGSRGAELHSGVAGHAHDLSVVAEGPSAFQDGTLLPWLTERSVDTVTLVGFMTQSAVQETAQASFALGFSVEVLSDATGAIDLKNRAGTVEAKTLQEASLVVLESECAAVLTTEQWLTSVRKGSDTKFTGLGSSSKADQAFTVRHEATKISAALREEFEETNASVDDTITETINAIGGNPFS